MANMSGFTPVRHLNGSPYNQSIIPYLHAAADGSIIQIGDVVQLAADPTSGAVGVIVSGMDVEGMSFCIRGANGTGSVLHVGVCVGFLANSVLPTREAIASENRIILVEVGEDVVFEAREDGDTTAIAATDVGDNYAYTTTAGNTTTKRSGMELDSTSKANTSTLPFTVIGLTKRPGNSFVTAPSKAQFDVVWNENFWKNGTTHTV